MAPQKKKPPTKSVIYVRVPLFLRQELDRACVRERRTKGEVVQAALRAYLEQHAQHDAGGR